MKNYFYFYYLIRIRIGGFKYEKSKWNAWILEISDLMDYLESVGQVRTDLWEKKDSRRSSLLGRYNRYKNHH